MTHINSAVASTISNMVDFGGQTEEALIALCAALFSIVVYSVAASVFGIPTSESHSLIAGLTGAAIAIHNGVGGVNFNEWVKVLYGLVLSLALGFFMGWVICKVITIICAAMDRRRTNGFFTVAQIFGAAFMSFMHGAQDGQKFIGVLFLGVAFCNGQSSVRGDDHPGMADAAVQYGHGRRDERRRREDHQICGNGYGKAGEVPGVFRRPGRSGVSAPLQCIRYSGIDDTHKDKRDHGRRRGEETVSDQLWRCKGYDADLDLYISGLRTDQLRCCKDIYYGILGGKNSGKETGFILF